MTMKKEQCEHMQDKLTGTSTPEELIKAAKAMGFDVSAEEAAETIAMAKASQEAEGKLSDESLKSVNGGENLEIPQFDTIRNYYKEKGPNLAFVLCIYYIPSPICYEIIQVIENAEG